jgi:glutathione S-transferase
MMELYFAPLACSLVPRIVAFELGTTIVYRQVEVFAKTLTDDGAPYSTRAPLELVPLLVLDDGESLGEVTAIVQYLAEAAPDSHLLPPIGTRDRYRTLSWLSYSVAELHKRSLWVIANRRTPREARKHARVLAIESFDHLERELAGREYVATGRFTVADAHLAWVLGLAPLLGLELGDRPALRAYADRLASRPSVREAFALELALLPAAMERQAAHFTR